jgi:hypothetical protein
MLDFFVSNNTEIEKVENNIVIEMKKGHMYLNFIIPE